LSRSCQPSVRVEDNFSLRQHRSVYAQTMLKAVKSEELTATGLRFGIVASKYNARYVDAMLAAAQKTLTEAGGAVEVWRVPGAFEIPVVAATLAQKADEPLAAIICLGVILRGATAHAQHIGETVSYALARIQVKHGKPVIHEVLLLENEAQAKARCLGAKHNRGREAALTAIEMAHVMKRFADEEEAKRRAWWARVEARRKAIHHE